MFQAFNLIPWLNAVADVQASLPLAGKSTAEQRVRASEILDRGGLSDRLDHRSSELITSSNSESRSLTHANDPKMILADDPTANLDPHSRETAMD